MYTKFYLVLLNKTLNIELDNYLILKDIVSYV